MSGQDPTLADVYSRIASQLDGGEARGYTIRAMLDAIREIAPGVWEQAARDAGWVPGGPEPDARRTEAPGEGDAGTPLVSEAVVAAVRDLAMEHFGDAIREGTDRLLAEKIPVIEAAVRRNERARILAAAERFQEPHRQPGTGALESAVPLTLLRAIITGDGEPAVPQPGTAGFLALNNGNPVYWSRDAAPGGYVCAVSVFGRPRNICGHPVESGPCPEHRGADWGPE